VSGAIAIPRLIAHRGGGDVAPENTLAGLRAAARLGYRGVEVDVMLSGSATPVLMHDQRLERTTSGRGLVAQTPDAELLALDAGSWFGTEFAGERVPTLAEAAALCRELRLWVNLEIKSAKGDERATGESLARAARVLWQDAEPLLSSFSVGALEAARRAVPELRRGLLVGVIPSNWPELCEGLGCVSLHCDQARNGNTEIQAVLETGMSVVCYTVNDADRVRALLALGASVITDRLNLVSAG
jgi:glycerophosphoryl diester phosphodiesterase